MRNPKLKGILFASTTGLLWGVLAIVLKVSLGGLSPVDITWFRFSTAFILLLLYFVLWQPGQLGILIRPPLLLILAALSLGLNYLGFITGLNYTSPIIAQVFIQIGPVLLAVSGFVIYKEKISFRQLTGLLLVVIGLSVFYHEQVKILFDQKQLLNKGVIWIIIGSLAWAVYAVSQKKLVRSHPPMQMNLFLFGLPALLYLPFVHFSRMKGLSAGEWLLLIFLGVNTLVAYGALAMALKYLEANKISVIITLNPIITFIIMAYLGYIGVTWIQPEHFNLIIFVGATVVIIGAILTVVSGRKNKREIT